MGQNLCSRKSDFTTGNKPTGDYSYFMQKAILSSSLHLTSVAHLLISSLHFVYLWIHSWASLVAQMVKNPPARWETWVRSLGWEDPLEEGMATHSSVRAWRIPRTKEPGDLQSMGVTKCQS